MLVVFIDLVGFSLSFVFFLIFFDGNVMVDKIVNSQYRCYIDLLDVMFLLLLLLLLSSLTISAHLV